MAITLTVGNFSGSLFGYVRSGSTSGIPALGSISAEPVAGLTLDVFLTGSSADQISFVGNQVGVVTGLTVNGVNWPLGPGSYDAPSNVTVWGITGAGVNGFNAGGTFTVDVANTAGPDTTAPTITSSSTVSNAEGSVLAHSLTANETVTWSIVSGADQAKFELSGSTLRWASNGVKDYETPDDSDTNNTYVVTVRATDTASNTTDQTITVTVTDVVEYTGPTWVGLSTASGNTTGFNIDFTSSGRSSGDLLFVVVATANQAVTAPSGFTEVPTYSPQSRGTAAAAGGLRLTLFSKTSSGSETTVAIPDSGDHQYAVGCVARASAGTLVIEVGAGNNVAAATSCTFGGVTTTGQALILTFVATDRDSAGPSFSAQTNANLGSLTERHDAGTTSGQGSGLVIYSGTKATSGASGNTTATQAASAAYCWITLSLRNQTTTPVYIGAVGQATIFLASSSVSSIYLGGNTLF